MLRILSIQVVFTLCKAYPNIVPIHNGIKLRTPSIFRPGVSLYRTPSWLQQQRYAQASSNRVPYVLYKTPSRYPKPGLSFAGGPWRTTISMSTSTPIYDLIRPEGSASPSLTFDGDRGPLYTIPAPNLSLADKPIVVDDLHNDVKSNEGPSLLSQSMYEVTEKFLDPLNHSKTTWFNTPSHQSLVKNVPTNLLHHMLKSPAAVTYHIPEHYNYPMLQQPQILKHTSLPGSQLTVQAFNTMLQQSSLADPNQITQNILFKPDPSYMHKLHSQIYPMQAPLEVFHPIVDPFPNNFVLPDQTLNYLHHNVVRQTNEIPNTLTQLSTASSNNIVVADIEASTEKNKNIQALNVIPDDKLKANDTQDNNSTKIEETITLAPLPQVKEGKENATEVIVETKGEVNNNDGYNISAVLTPFQGTPFSKDNNMVNVTYSFIKKETTTPEGDTIVNSQIVEGSVMEDKEFIEEQKKKREPAPLRVHLPPEFISASTLKPKDLKKSTKENHKRIFESKTMYDEKTNEAVFRIYANRFKRGDERKKQTTSTEKSQSTNRGRIKMRQLPADESEWKGSSYAKEKDKEIDKNSEPNHLSNFGLKLRTSTESNNNNFQKN